MQDAIAIAIVALAVLYFVWRLVAAFRGQACRCGAVDSCPMVEESLPKSSARGAM
jgi:hypothetical protein